MLSNCMEGQVRHSPLDAGFVYFGAEDGDAYSTHKENEDIVDGNLHGRVDHFDIEDLPSRCAAWVLYPSRIGPHSRLGSAPTATIGLLLENGQVIPAWIHRRHIGVVGALLDRWMLDA